MSWTKTGNIRGPEGPPGQPPAAMNLDDLADVHVAGAASGTLLIKQNDGSWQAAHFDRKLSWLQDVDAPANTPQGMVLGTTAVGAWGPVDLPANGVPPSPEDEAAYVLYSYGSTLQWVLISDLSQEIAMPLFQLTDVVTSAHVPAGKFLGTTSVGIWTAVDPPGWGRWSGTQAQYDAITHHDPNTLYVITGG